MNIPQTLLTADQETAVRYFRRQWNKTANVPLTAQDYLAMRVQEVLNAQVANWKQAAVSSDVPTAYKAATPAVQAQVDALLGITPP